MKELLFWSKQVLQYLDLKRLAVGLNDEEQRLFKGLQEAVDKTNDLAKQANERNRSTKHLNTSP